MSARRPAPRVPTGAITMADIAELANVSASTVSRALTDSKLISRATREKIQEIARSTGFSVNPLASGLRSKKSNVVSVLITLIHDRHQHVSDPFMMTMLAHVADALTEAGYDMLLSKVSVHEDGWIERLFATRRPAAALLIGQSFEHASIEKAARAGLPVVAWGARLPRQSYATVGSDNRQGGFLAAQHMIAQGYRNIAFLGDRRTPEIAQRFEGFRRAHRKAGLPVQSGLVTASPFDGASAFAAARELVARGTGMDGIVAGSDVIAMSAIRALISAGRQVPRDVGLVGFDDIELAGFITPSLTTIRQDLALGARLLVEKMVAVIAGEAAESIELPARLVVRESSPKREE
jgi:DNA-binding LacI/PurR family transcriptional regulator